ncbi:hypothetical protein MHBO_000093 [Bonamia ostreae]
MNLSGEAVKQCITELGISPDDVAVVHDCLEVEVGEVKIRKKGSLNGHHGLLNIARETGHKKLKRLSIGIGRPDSVEEVIDYVLGKPDLEDFAKIEGFAFNFVGNEFIKELYDAPEDKMIGIPVLGHEN